MDIGAVSIQRDPKKVTMWCDSTRGAIAAWAVVNIVPVPPPVDKLSIEKTGKAPVWCLHTLVWLSSGVQSICDSEKMYDLSTQPFQ